MCPFEDAGRLNGQKVQIGSLHKGLTTIVMPNFVTDGDATAATVFGPVHLPKHVPRSGVAIAGNTVSFQIFCDPH